MSKGGRVLWALVKWLVIPIGLGYAGYTYYGPMIGRQPPESLAKIKESLPIGTKPETPQDGEKIEEPATRVDYTPPEVEVNVLKRDGRTIQEPKDNLDLSESAPNPESAPAESDETEPPASGTTSNL